MANSNLKGPSIQTRDDLTFTARDHNGCLINWNVPHVISDKWGPRATEGVAFFSEIAMLAGVSEKDAYSAMIFAATSENWRGGWGQEAGFISAMAKAAIVGLRALQDGAVPFDPDIFDEYQLQSRKTKRNSVRRRQRRLAKGINVIPFPARARATNRVKSASQDGR